MGNPLPTRQTWKRQLVTTRTPGGQIYVLLSLEKRTCDNCPGGTEVNSVWVSPGGETERLTWCTSCFNARTEPAEPRAEEATRRRELVERARAAPTILSWNGARAAVEDLERRGLL